MFIHGSWHDRKGCKYSWILEAKESPASHVDRREAAVLKHCHIAYAVECLMVWVYLSTPHRSIFSKFDPQYHGVEKTESFQMWSLEWITRLLGHCHQRDKSAVVIYWVMSHNRRWLLSGSQVHLSPFPHETNFLYALPQATIQPGWFFSRGQPNIAFPCWLSAF